MRCSVLLALAMSLTSCGSTMPAPPTTPQPDDAFVEVPYPPPAARPEIIPDKPTKASVWVDGAWRWRQGRWVWSWGGWLEVPENVTYQRPVSRRRTDGTLWFAKGTWRDASGKTVHAPKILAPPPDEPALEQGPAAACAPLAAPSSTVAHQPTASGSPPFPAASGACSAAVSADSDP